VRGQLLLFIFAGLVVAVTIAVTSLPAAPSSATGGNSITSPYTAGNSGQYTSLELDAAGNPVVSFYDVTNGNLLVMHCTDPNCANIPSVQSPDTTDDVGPFTSLAIDSSGNPVVSYQDVDASRMNLLHCTDVNCNAGNIAPVHQALQLGDVFDYSSLVLDASGNPAISYRAANFDLVPTQSTLWVLRCGNPNCTEGNNWASPDGNGLGSDSSIALDATGNPVVSYYALNGTLKVLHCGNPICTFANTIESPDTGGRYTSLALERRSRFDQGCGCIVFFSIPVVSYYTGSDLKVLRCGNTSCSMNNSITSPDTSGDVGLYTSLARDAIGYPVVSYYDQTNGDLKVLHCNDVNCAGGDDSIESPDTEGNVGQYTSLALDAAGNPVVSYYDVTNGDLKVLHCDNPNCAESPKPEDTATPTNASTPAPSSTPTPPAGMTPTPGGMVGDANKDGVVTAVDAALVLQYSAGLIATINANADVNGDATINAIDSALILQFIADLIPNLPP
jgi:hypothetical protein